VMRDQFAASIARRAFHLIYRARSIPRLMVVQLDREQVDEYLPSRNRQFAIDGKYGDRCWYNALETAKTPWSKVWIDHTIFRWISAQHSPEGCRGLDVSAALQRIEDLRQQVSSQQLAKTQAIDAAQQRVSSEEFVCEANRINERRMAQLVETGDVSQRDYELAKLAFDSSRTNLAAAKAVFERTGRDYDATIAGTNASRSSAEGDIAVADRDMAVVDIQLAKTAQQVVIAPRDGIVLSVSASEGAYLKPGSAICVVIPNSDARFVEAWIDGMDVPLVAPREVRADGTEVPGSRVRLQFEGWPAVQFVGWPSVAVDTFGGEVVSVYATDDGDGRFRIVVASDPSDEPWLGVRFLRQGVRAKAWVLLRNVPLWQEIWRQLNSFPPVVSEAEPG